MSFIQWLEKRAEPIRRAILEHPFVRGVGDGTLPVEKFKYYIRQDYVYLIDYSRVLALGAVKAPDLEGMGWFARLLHETLNTEMELHRGYCAQFGISRRELEETQAAPTTLAYTRFLLTTAYQGTYGELVAALLPCQWGYWEVGDHLARQGEPEHQPLYCQWIRMYASEEFKALGQWLRDVADRIGGQSGEAQRAAMEKAYLTSLRYEYLFWDMAWKEEAWPV